MIANNFPVSIRGEEVSWPGNVGRASGATASGI